MDARGVALTALRVANAVAFLAFLLSVAVQVNDPDPVAWMAIYGAAAAGCLGRGRLSWATYAGITLLALVWAATLVPGVLAEAELLDLFRTMKHDNHAEEARETGGLLLVAAWMAVLGVERRRAQAASAATLADPPARR